MVGDLVFFVAVSTLILHEMDAVDKKEWRLLFVLRRLPDRGALRWFILLHLPLLVGVLVLVSAAASPTVRWVEGVVDVFLIAHATLHERIGASGQRAFVEGFSRSLIWAAAGLGALHLVLLLAGAA